MAEMLLASVLFLVTHLGVSSTPLRGALVNALTTRGFLGVYSLMALATLVYMIMVYADVPRYDYLWSPDPVLYWVPKLLMVVALTFMFGGFMVKNPTTVGLEGALDDPAELQSLTKGMNRITRHPFQWGVILWAGSHIVANGDVVSVVFFATFLTLSLAGSFLIDVKKARVLGDRWKPFHAVTSNVPFAAIVSGRNKLVIKELAAPITVGIVAYLAIFWGHRWIAGVGIYW